MLSFRTLNFTSWTLMVLVSLASCKKSNETTSPTTPETPNPSLQLATSATFGSIFTDGNGKSLYFFAIDATGESGCSGNCAVTWPVYYAGSETAPAGIAAADLATITRADGTKQTTFKGWPMYYYAGDTKKSDLNGDGIGGTWFVAKPDYSVVFANKQLVGHDGKNYTADSKEGTGATLYMTDAAGRTLYAFAPDTFNKNNFTKADLSNNAVWPIFESEVLNVPSVLKKDFMVQINSVGKKQLTYKGHPLYYFGNDARRGDTKGVSFPAPGVWPVITLNTPALLP
jgi:predicted lipoprotein with Yx(FWY)xxD motif